MACSACGTENLTGAKFCNGCGAALTAVCVGCGHANPPASRFCNECGQALTVASPPTEPTSTPTTELPGSPPPRRSVEQTPVSRDTLDSERKQVTILFADVVGSTALIQELDDEEAQRLLDGVVQRMVEAVQRYEGTVSRKMGDGLMALFGAPVAHEDHALRACFAALAMLEANREYAEDVRQAHGTAIQIRVGINSGGVIVRDLSDDRHRDYTAMGPTVHLASRMEQLATPGTAVLGPSTLALVEGFVDVRPLGPSEVKGFGRPVETYELLGSGRARTRLQATADRGLTPFVGRDDECTVIGRALARAQAGQGQVVALVAEAGVGKSRLAWEAIQSDRAGGSRVLQTGAQSYGQSTAWLPVIDLLRSYFQIDRRDDHAAMREKVTAGLCGLDPALEPELPALLALLDVPVEDAAWVQLDPALRRRDTLDAVRQLLLRESRRQPLLVVFEDLHWIDSETQALLDGLVESLPTARILLLVNYRPEYTHTWTNKGYYTQIRIDPLGEQSAEELLAALLGADPGIQRLKALLIQRTEGTPLFLEESVRGLVETGVLVGERGAYRLDRSVEEIQVPPTVQAMLAARIDRLPAAEKRLLQTASVIGKDVPFWLLQAIAEIPEAELHVSLSRLQAAELLYPVSLFPEPEYTFKHALTHEVAYGSLLQERRKTLHARIVAAIEQRYPDRLDEHVDRLAHHAVRAEIWEQAVSYCRRAGARAAGHSVAREAIRYFEQALAALERLPHSRERAENAIDLRFELRTACWSNGERDRAAAYLDQARALSEASGDRLRLGRAAAYQAHYLRTIGDGRRAVEVGETAIALATDLGELGLQFMATDIVGGTYHELGQFSRAIELLRKNVAALAGPLAYDRLGLHLAPAVTSRNTLASCLTWQGQFPEALMVAEEMLQIAETIGHPPSLSVAWLGVGIVCAIRGDVSRSIDHLERSFAIGRRIDLPSTNVSEPACLGHAYTLAGRSEEALPLFELALARAAAVNYRINTSIWTCWMSECLVQLGQMSAASEAAARALDLARAHHVRGFEAYVLRQHAEIAARRDPPGVDDAEVHYREALALAEELGMRPLQAHCHLGLGKLYRRIGRLDEAQAALSRAVTMLREMEMTLWLPEAEAVLTATSSAPRGSF